MSKKLVGMRVIQVRRAIFHLKDKVSGVEFGVTSLVPNFVLEERAVEDYELLKVDFTDTFPMKVRTK